MSWPDVVPFSILRAMSLRHLLRKPAACLALFGLLFASHAPLLAQLRAESSPFQVALCTGEGIRLVSVGGEDAPPAFHGASVAHCPLCVAGHDAGAPPPAAVAWLEPMAPAPAPQAARTSGGHAAVVLARTRAQPPPAHA
jgi:hypothetical protein